MSFSIEVRGFEKKDNCISGQIKCLGLFEVNRNEIVQYEIEDTKCVFPNGISTIDYLNGEKRFGYDFEILDGDLSFYQQIPNGMQGTNYRVEDGIVYEVMFSPDKLKEVVDKLIKVAEYFQSRSYNPINKGEKENLELFSEILDLIKIFDGIVSLKYA